MSALRFGLRIAASARRAKLGAQEAMPRGGRAVADGRARNFHALGVFPSPLWGGVRGGGSSWRTQLGRQQLPPSPTLPHKGGGSTPRVGRGRTPTSRR